MAAHVGTTAAETLRELLANFTGTESYHRHPLSRRVLWTDGVKAFADSVGGYWLLDVLATELPRFVIKHGIVFVTLSVKDGAAEVSAVQDNGKPKLWSRDVEFTDCPEGDWQFYMAAGGPGDCIVILLPSEY